MTNFEWIKDMDIDGLAKQFERNSTCNSCSIRKFCDKDRPNTCVVNCKSVWRKWLKRDIKENN